MRSKYTCVFSVFKVSYILLMKYERLGGGTHCHVNDRLVGTAVSGLSYAYLGMSNPPIAICDPRLDVPIVATIPLQ